jgi:DNA-binding Lrp family transcriptional regulator
MTEVTSMRRELDKQEHGIVKELIANPRISDNQIGKNANIPIKTVNRKRKKLEQEGLLQYYTYLDTSIHGTKNFGSRKMYIISFNEGITRTSFFERFPLNSIRNNLGRKHIFESHLGEKNGRLVFIIILESRQESDILEIFNAEIMPVISQSFGDNAIKEISVIPLTHMLTILHNYVPKRNATQSSDAYTDKETLFVADIMHE